MFVRNDAQVALNEIAERSVELADHFASTAKRVPDLQLAEMFQELAQRHYEMATELAEQIRAIGDLPQAPDPDRETAREVLSAIKEALSGNAATTTLDDHIHREEGLIEAAEAALGKAMPPAAHVSLMHSVEMARAARDRLAAARA